MKSAVLLIVFLVVTAMNAAADIVSTARFQSHQTNADLIVRDPKLVYGLEFTRAQNEDPQSLSILLSTHPSAASGVYGAARFRPEVGRIELRPGTVAMCRFRTPENVNPDMGDDDDAQGSSATQQEAADVMMNDEQAYKWWMIVFEDLEIGAEGTYLQIATSPPGPRGEQQIAIVLREGGPVRINHRALNLQFKLTRAPNGPDTVYVITWSPEHPDQIRVNNHVVQAGDDPNAHQKIWLHHAYQDKLPVNERILEISAERTLLLNSP